MTPRRLDGKPVAPWIYDRLLWARRQGWRGTVTSGYRSPAEQRRLWDEWRAGRRPGPVAFPGTSNHEKLGYPGGAVDVTDADTLARLMGRYPGRGQPLRRGIPGEPWHFSLTGR
jgi:hypothetical protein